MSVASRLADLRKKKAQSKEDNKKDLLKDFQNQKRKSLKLKELEKAAEKEEGYDDETEKNKDPRSNNLNYTLEECEEWDEKRGQREQAKKRSSGNSYSILAEHVYNKEVLKIEVDREDYAKQKAHAAATKKGTYRSDNYLVQKPSTAKVSALASGIIETSKKRADALRKKQEAATKNDDSSFINEKNKQFNMKINREYK